MNQPSPSKNHKQSLGKRGEQIAATYLTEHGYTIIERNFKARYGEIDLIATKGTCLVFVEVKTRKSDAYGGPEEAITPRKLHEVIQTAQYYSLCHNTLDRPQRIDAIAIMIDAMSAPHIHHIENISQ